MFVQPRRNKIALSFVDWQFSCPGVVRIMQRRSNWTPTVIFNRTDRTDPSEPDGSSVTALSAICLDGGLSQDDGKLSDRSMRSGADVRFAIGVAVALALPALLGMGLFIAATAFLRVS
jgi:hypothetical protein